MTHRIVAVHSGPQIEIWLAVHADGQIVLHLENDGPALLRRGAQARGRAIEDMEEIKQLARRYDRPRFMQEVDAAFRALAPRLIFTTCRAGRQLAITSRLGGGTHGEFSKIGCCFSKPKGPTKL